MHLNHFYLVCTGESQPVLTVWVSFCTKKMDDIVYDNAVFPDLKKVNFTVNEQSGETKIQCNNSDQMKDVELS